METKDKVFDIFHSFIKMVQNQFNKMIKFLRSDHGSEFLNHRFCQMLDSFGILHQKSCVYTPTKWDSGEET